MSDELARMLYEGALAVSQGRREQGRDLLMAVLERDEMNEQAWLWLSGAVDDPGDQQIALENVLSINPDSQPAREGLALLQSGQSGTRAPASDWVPPPPLDPNDALELSCWKCGSSLYSVAQFCWNCHAPVHACNNCVFIQEVRCKEIQGLTNAVHQAAQNTCPWWRPPQ
ncbi:MAG TPA: tetratricopeptide repeat protein [Roseiflexaceae bacterium]|nr:tetratricopeptide repeat protein [Roseiflexaceae bacterium]